jgi:hypothetical protein
VITKAALFEQLLMSSSCEMIFLTRATNDLLGMCFVANCELFGDCSSKRVYHGQSKKGYIRGKETVPVISLEGAIGVLL